MRVAADGGDHAAAAALLAAIRLDGHAVRPARPALNGDGGHPHVLDAPTLEARARRS